MAEGPGGAAGAASGGRGRAGDGARAAGALAQRLRHILHHVPDVTGVQHRAHRRVALPRQGKRELGAVPLCRYEPTSPQPLHCVLVTVVAQVSA